mgnify:CR=1 FL=1
MIVIGFNNNGILLNVREKVRVYKISISLVGFGFRCKEVCKVFIFFIWGVF